MNGTSMSPIGKLPLFLSLGDSEDNDVFHIYPQVKGTLLSWKAAKGLKIIIAGVLLSTPSCQWSTVHSSGRAHFPFPV
jgi:hypothetical protein